MMVLRGAAKMVIAAAGIHDLIVSPRLPIASAAVGYASAALMSPIRLRMMIARGTQNARVADGPTALDATLPSIRCLRCIPLLLRGGWAVKRCVSIRRSVPTSVRCVPIVDGRIPSFVVRCSSCLQRSHHRRHRRRRHHRHPRLQMDPSHPIHIHTRPLFIQRASRAILCKTIGSSFLLCRITPWRLRVLLLMAACIPGTLRRRESGCKRMVVVVRTE